MAQAEHACFGTDYLVQENCRKDSILRQAVMGCYIVVCLLPVLLEHWFLRFRTDFPEPEKQTVDLPELTPVLPSVLAPQV